MPYPWSPMPSRQPLRFPNGKRLAVIVTVNCEYWDAVKPYKEPYYAGGPPIMSSAAHSVYFAVTTPTFALVASVLNALRSVASACCRWSVWTFSSALRSLKIA